MTPAQAPAFASGAHAELAGSKPSGYEWEVIQTAPATAAVAPLGSGCPTPAARGLGPCEEELRPRVADAVAEEAARMLRMAASAAEALAPRLPGALRRAEVAEAEVARLRAALEAAESRIQTLERQQEQLTQGFTMEIRQRDAEIAAYKASSSAALFSEREARPSSEAEVPEAIEVVTFTAEGPLGIDFDESNVCLKIVAAVEPGSQACGRMAVGDEVVSIKGVSARNLSWEELCDALAVRPAVVSVRRANPEPDLTAAGGANPFGQRLGSMLGKWTGGAVRALRATMADAEGERRAGEEDMPDDLGPEARNRPFYELVRSSMAEACIFETADPGSAGFRHGEEVNFERWLRQFHNDRDDEWYSSNHVRVYNAFKPHWDEVVAAQRALAAS